jgi:hypothetical protein
VVSWHPELKETKMPIDEFTLEAEAQRNLAKMTGPTDPKQLHSDLFEMAARVSEATIAAYQEGYLQGKIDGLKQAKQIAGGAK